MASNHHKKSLDLLRIANLLSGSKKAKLFKTEQQHKTTDSDSSSRASLHLSFAPGCQFRICMRETPTQIDQFQPAGDKYTLGEYSRSFEETFDLF